MTKILLIIFMSIATITALFTLVYTISDLIIEYRRKRKLEALENAADEAMAAAEEATAAAEAAIEALNTVETASAEDAPAEETPADEAPAEEAPAEETPADPA